MKKAYVFVAWPSWRYGPAGASGIFDHESEVPAGWVDHPSKVKEAKGTTPAPAPVPAPTTPAAVSGEAPKVDGEGTPFDPAMHTGTLTKGGLWRMKVGVARPPKADAPLDL